MPEGDTIYKIAAALRPRLVRKLLDRCEVRNCSSQDLAPQRVLDIRARGKHLFIELESGMSLRSHLGMYGTWHRYRSDEPWRKPRARASIVLATEDEVFVCFNAKEVELLRSAGIRQRTIDTRLANDLLQPDLNLDAVVVRAREFLEPGTVLADVLLDQRVAAGIGNVYKSEVLFIQNQEPRTALGDVADAGLRDLYATARRLLRANVHGGARVTRFVDDGAGRLWVYGRAGLPCFRCGGNVEHGRLGRHLRSTYWCPACQ